MKIKTFMAIAIALTSFTMLSTSCEKEEKETPAAEQLAGSYTGNLTLAITSMGYESTDVATMQITEVDESTVSLTIPAMGSGSMSLPSITVSSIPAVKTTVNGVEVVKASLDSYSGTITVSGAEKSYNFTDLVILGSDNTVSITTSLQYGKMPFAMTCTFSGTK